MKKHSVVVGALAVALGLASGCDMSSAEAAAPPASTSASAAARAPTPEANDDEPDPNSEDEDALAPSDVAPTHPPRVDRRGRFLDTPDHPLREALATADIAEIERGHGGRSLAFKITLADGTVGYFKPEQSFSAAHFYSELASYYLDRELGLGRVAPTIGRRMAWEPLRQAAMGDQRVSEVTVDEDGTVRGAFIWWIPERLARIQPGRGWERWIRVTGGILNTPYQRPRHWSEGRLDPEDGDTPAGDPDTADRAAELSDMILFDYLTTNVDRWGGNFTNVRTREDGGPLIYLDNGAGFTAGPTARIPLMDARLHAVERFRRSTVDAIRQLDRDRLVRRMLDDPLEPILDERQLDHLFLRRDHLLEHVAQTEATHGPQTWL